MFHIEGETRGKGGRTPRKVEYTPAEHGYYIGRVMYKEKSLEFFIDEDDFERVKTRNWHAVTGGAYIGCGVVVDGQKKVLMLHNLIMNRLEFPGKGASETVDHINRNGLDNRKNNLRVVSQTLQNVNQKTKPRTVEVPGIFDKLPRHIWYIKANGAHGERFGIDLKSEGIARKTTSSKKVSIQDKLQEALRIREELYTLYPYLRQED